MQDHRHTHTPRVALAVALVALFLALGGSAVAAGRYLLTSTSQIQPSVLRQLERRTEPPSRTEEASTPCNANSEVVGGGWTWRGEGHIEVTGSYPRGADEWVIVARVSGAGSLEANAVCEVKDGGR